MGGKPPAGTATWTGVKGGHTVAEGIVMIQKGLEDPKVKYMREQMEKLGCRVTDNFFQAIRCNKPASGFFDPRGGIKVCANNLRFQDEVTQVLIHELIHAYDQCRVKNLDWKSDEHTACAEVCALLQEFMMFLTFLMNLNCRFAESVIINRTQLCVRLFNLKKILCIYVVYFREHAKYLK
ncbi:unnamed protein product [Cuscuta campestris]|uniref:Mitochondrial inner membrane protease ATP23 n=1 Tax=Cuscuta campestris TaxID=132261 RepID=A0A484K2C9_9ASTE|nr:unnamed protein product [Cuscuta campestris]